MKSPLHPDLCNDWQALEIAFRGAVESSAGWRRPQCALKIALDREIGHQLSMVGSIPKDSFIRTAYETVKRGLEAADPESIPGIREALGILAGFSRAQISIALLSKP